MSHVHILQLNKWDKKYPALDRVNTWFHNRTCRGGNFPPKFPSFGQNSNFSGSDKKIFG